MGEGRVGEWGVYAEGQGAVGFASASGAFYRFPLLLLYNKNTNITRDFIHVTLQRSARGNFLVVSRVGR